MEEFKQPTKKQKFDSSEKNIESSIKSSPNSIFSPDMFNLGENLFAKLPNEIIIHHIIPELKNAKDVYDYEKSLKSILAFKNSCSRFKDLMISQPNSMIY